MLFNSFQFVLFFPCAAAGYFLLPQRWRWVWLLAASYAFYMAWEPGYVVLLWCSTLVDYVAGRAMGAVGEKRIRRRWLALSLTTNLGLLFFFKYYNFFAETLRPLAADAGWPGFLPHSEFLLPVGISFYTFQTLGYSIDVYRGQLKPETHLGKFALYVAFFPQLVAGPIERAGRLLPQFTYFAGFHYPDVVCGLRRMAWGMVKKVVIADRVGAMVDHVYADPAAQPGPVLIAATLLFAVQIYCDFSGYCDIALGAARIFGIRLMENFRQPYFAASIGEFWGRWHISLSTWFRDYVYLPLGGNRVARPHWVFNVLVVFLVSGLWHGASWTFALWGLLHAGYLLAERLAPVALRLPKPLAVLRTFTLVCIGWVFFRAASLGDALTVLRGSFAGWGEFLGDLNLDQIVIAFNAAPADLAIAVAYIALLIAVELLERRVLLHDWLGQRGVLLRWTAYAFLLWSIILFGVFRQQEFIYFVF